MNEFGASRLIGIVSHGPMILQNTDEGGTAKVDPTLSVAGMAADAAATGDAIAKASVQADYTENDPTSPAYMKNKPFHDEVTDLVYAGTAEFMLIDPTAMRYSADILVDYVGMKMIVGRTYSLFINGKLYTGVAKDLSEINGIPTVGIGDGDMATGEGSTFMAVEIDGSALGGSATIMYVDTTAINSECECWLAVVEGDKAPNTRRVPEDTIETMLDGYFQRVSSAYFGVEELSGGYTVEAVFNGEEITLTEAETRIENYGDSWLMQYVEHVNAADTNYHDIAMMTQVGLVIIDDNADTGRGFTAKSITIKNSTIFAKKLPLKKLDKKFLPDTVPLLEDVDVGTSTDTLTWDGNTEGRVIVVKDETTSYVKVSDEIIPATFDGQFVNAVTSDGIRHGASVYTEGGIRKCTELVYSGEAGATDGFVTLPETGIYFAYYPASNSYTTCVRIDGWERHVPNIVKKLPAECIPLNGDITETVYYQDINWNGVIEDHIIHTYNDRQLVRVSDYVPDYNSLLAEGWMYANTTSADGSAYGWSFDMANAPVDENGSKSFLCNDSAFGLMVVFATKDNHQMSFQEGSIQITLPKAGIYFALREDGTYVHNINCGAFRIPVTKVREEALPDTPGKELGTDWLAQIAMPGSLKWDGVIGSRAYVPLAEEDGIMMGWVHVYDDSLLEEMFAPESVSSIAFAIAINQYGTKIAATNDMDTPIPIVSQENGFVDIAEGLIFYVPSDNFSLEDGSVFPKRGLYFFAYSLLPEGIDMSLMNACGLLVVGYTFQDQGGSKSWNDLENKPFYDELQQKRIVLYDGNVTFQRDGGDASSLFEGAAYIDITDIENPDSVNFILNGATLNLPFVGTGADLGSTEEPMASALAWRDPEGTGVNLIMFLKNSTTGEAGFLLTGVGEEYIDQTFQFRAQGIIQERVLQQIHPKFVPGYDVSYKNTDTIEWDGKDDGRISCSITDGDLKLTLVKVSDVIPDKALFENEYHYTQFTQGVVADNTATGVMYEFDNGFIPVDDLVYVVQDDSTSINDIAFPEKGLYFGRIDYQSGEKIYIMKLSVPGMSAPSEEVESFKLKPEHLPESKIVVVSADFETLKLEKTPAEIAGLMETGKMVLFSATASPFAITNSDGVVTATVSTMNPAYNSDGTGLLEIGTLFFDAEGNLIDQKISSLNLNV